MDEIDTKAHRLALLLEIRREQKLQQDSKGRENALRTQLDFIDEQLNLDALYKLAQSTRNHEKPTLA